MDWMNLDIHTFVEERNEALLSADYAKLIAYLVKYDEKILKAKRGQENG